MGGYIISLSTLAIVNVDTSKVKLPILVYEDITAIYW